MKKGFYLLIFSGVLAFFSCQGIKKTTSCRELFVTHYDTYIDKYMSTMPDVDTMISRKVAEYVVNRLYQLDSSFVLLDGKDAHEWMRLHSKEVQIIQDSINIIFESER